MGWGLRMKNLNIMGVHCRNQFSKGVLLGEGEGEIMKKPLNLGDCL